MKKNKFLILVLLATVQPLVFGMELQQKKSSWSPSWQWLTNSAIYKTFFSKNDNQDSYTPIVNLDGVKESQSSSPRTFNPFWHNKLKELRTKEKQQQQRELIKKEKQQQRELIKKEIFEPFKNEVIFLDTDTKKAIIKKLLEIEKQGKVCNTCFNVNSSRPSLCANDVEKFNTLVNEVNNIKIKTDPTKGIPSMYTDKMVKSKIQKYIDNHIKTKEFKRQEERTKEKPMSEETNKSLEELDKNFKKTMKKVQSIAKECIVIGDYPKYVTEIQKIYISMIKKPIVENLPILQHKSRVLEELIKENIVEPLSQKEHPNIKKCIEQFRKELLILLIQARKEDTNKEN